MRTHRIEWLDALRALAMLWVMLGHCSHQVGPLFVWTSPIKIPLFFAISGYLFRLKDGQGFVPFAISRARRLLIAYVLLALISTGVMMAVDIVLQHESIRAVAAAQLSGLLSGSKLWFVPCLMWMELIAYVIHRISARFHSRSGIAHVLLTAGFSAVGWALIAAAGTLPWHPETALSMIIFFQLGYLLRSTAPHWQKIKPRCWMILLAVYLLLCYLQAATGISGINVNLNRWPCPPVNIVTCAIGIAALFMLFSAVRFSKAVVFMGQNTLTYYAFHQIVQMGLTFSLRLIAPSLPDPENCLWMGALIVTAACGICGVMSLFINRYFPILTGKPTSK